MITLACKSFSVRHEAEGVVLDIEDGTLVPGSVPQLLSKADVAKRLAISKRKVAMLAAIGKLPPVRVGGSVRFREADVLQLITEDREFQTRPIISALPARTPIAGSEIHEDRVRVRRGDIKHGSVDAEVAS
jgi:excisionase family DNA binding protein